MNHDMDDLIEDALCTYPLADTPSHFSKEVMRRISLTATVSPSALRFRLTWMDYALGFFMTLLPAVGFFIWACLPRLALLRLEFQWQVLQASSFLPVLTISLAAAGVLLFSAFIFSLNLLLRPGGSLA